MWWSNGRHGPKPAATLRPLKLDLDISTDLGSNFLFSGFGLSSRLAGSARYRPGPRPAARQRHHPHAQRRFDAYGQKLDIERGVLTFNGLLDNPGLDVRAVRKGLAVEPASASAVRRRSR